MGNCCSRSGSSLADPVELSCMSSQLWVSLLLSVSFQPVAGENALEGI